MSFHELGLAEPFLRATDAAGYETVTPIQAEAIPVVLQGRDLIGCAQTGTGKTAAFTLPMLDRLMQMRPPRQPDDASTTRPATGTNRSGDRDGRNGSRRNAAKGARPKPRTLRALVLLPTRELAAQIGASLDRYGRFTPLRHTVVFGGVSQYHQVKALRHGVDVLVATPGRLLDLMEQGYIDLSQIEILVLDEADQMLDMGFLPALKRIVAATPKQRQTLMFSATMPPPIRRLAQEWLSRPAAIAVGPVATPVERITQSVHLVDKKRKPDLLAWFLKQSPRARTLVFSRTKHGADKIVKRLKSEGLRATAIHGNKSQGARTRALAQFTGDNPPVLVATDIAARGLDIRDVSHIVNFDLPEVPETYIHRIGRTARAGSDGAAVSFCAGDERGLLAQIERLTKRTIEVEPTVAGFEPTDPVSHDTRIDRRSGNGSRSGGRNGSRAGGGGRTNGKPRRYGAGTDAARSGDGPPRRQKRSAGAAATRKKATSAGGPATNGGARRRKRRPLGSN